MFNPKFLIYLFVFLLTSCQSWFYRPNKDRFMDPRVLGINFTDQSFRIPWNDQLHGWLLHSKQKSERNPAQGTVAYFYDASKNITHHFRQVTWLTENNFDVYLFDYPGFGKSTGSFKSAEVADHIKRVIRYVRYRTKGKLVLLCQSTGGLFCAKAMGELSRKQQKQVDTFVLDNAYASYRELMKYYFHRNWWSRWAKFMIPAFLSDDESAVEEISKIRVPTIVIHAENNRSIPYSLGHWIYDNLNTKKYLWRVQKVGHLESFQYKAQQEFFLNVLFNQKKYLK